MSDTLYIRTIKQKCFWDWCYHTSIKAYYKTRLSFLIQYCCLGKRCPMSGKFDQLIEMSNVSSRFWRISLGQMLTQKSAQNLSSSTTYQGIEIFQDIYFNALYCLQPKSKQNVNINANEIIFYFSYLDGGILVTYSLWMLDGQFVEPQDRVLLIMTICLFRAKPLPTWVNN